MRQNILSHKHEDREVQEPANKNSSQKVVHLRSCCKRAKPKTDVADDGKSVAADVAAGTTPIPAETLDVADVADAPGVRGKGNSDYPFIPKWPEPIDGAKLLDELTAAFKKHLVMSEGSAETAALWCMFAQAHDCFHHSPILAFLSPVYGCGKTNGMCIVNALTRSRLFSHVTPASIFRFIERHPGVGLLFDDGEGYVRADNRDMMSILDSGHCRTGASVLRCDGDTHEPRDFSTWTPKAIGKVGDLPPSLKTRSIIIKMKRKTADETVDDLSDQEVQELKKGAARRIARWVADHRAELKTASPEVPPCLYNRARDNWKPLLAVADAVGGQWPEKARRAATLLNGEAEDTTEGVMLLKDCKIVFGDADRMSTAELCRTLNDLEPRPWGDIRDGKGIDAKTLAKVLSGFDVEAPKNIRCGEQQKVLKGYKREWFEDAWSRYLPKDSGGG